MTLFSFDRRGRGSRRSARADGSHVAAPATAALLAALLVAFYAVTVANMNGIGSTVDDLSENPYPVTVAAGEVRTSLLQLGNLAERLEYVRTPQAVDAVEAEFAAVDAKIAGPLATVAELGQEGPHGASALAGQYAQLQEEQRRLLELCRDPSVTDEEVGRWVEGSIEPTIDSMVTRSTAVISGAHRSFDALCVLANSASGETIASASIIMAATLAALALFLLVIRRQNAQQACLQESLEEALEAARQANRAKSRFLSSMSHDIRTPCSAIVGMTEIAERHVGDPERVGECLEKITLSSHHLLSLINDVLDMSKIENGRLVLDDEPFCLGELVALIDVIARPQAKTKRLSFAIEAPALDAVRVRGDALRLKQVLLNLISNAIKYTEPDGHVTLRVAPVEASACAQPEEVRYRFEVEDDGIGMTPEFVGRIFEPFERARTDDATGVEGTGLGMSIAKSIVDQMGGSISVRSERHRGTVFCVELPLRPASDEAPASGDGGGARDASAFPPRVDFAGVRVLLAEDDEINAEIACDIIGRTHAEVEWVRDGAEALDAVLSAPEGRYDVVFMDVQMPRMDGLEASSALRRACACRKRVRPPIVAMTANAYVEDRQRASEAGMDGYVVKPIGFDEVCRVLGAFLPPRGSCKAAQVAVGDEQEEGGGVQAVGDSVQAAGLAS